ncbi:gamma tubulin complex Spc97/GCP2 subunit Alp4 [Pestalotiopsis sp. IQ-011]
MAQGSSDIKDMEFFIMLSSVAGVVGHMSQANYAAGNTFQDALARSRARRGEPAVAIDLGAVGSVGYVAQMEASGDDRLRTRVDDLGFGSVDIEQVLALVEAAIQSPLRVSPDDSQIIVGSYLNASASQTAMLNDKRLGTLRIASQRGSQDTSTSASNSAALAAVLIQALSQPSTTPEEATALLTEALAAKTADIFSLPLGDIDPEFPLSRYGVDSLVAVELRNWLGATVVGKSEYMVSKVAGNGTEQNDQGESGKAANGEVRDGLSTNGHMENGTSG